MAQFDDVPTPEAGIPNTDAPQPAETEAAGRSRDDSDSDDDRPARMVPLKDILPEDIARGIHTFDDLPLHELIREAVQKIGWTTPTPVQKLCLPYSLRGRDVAGFAQTGTGKTGVFLMTILNKLLTNPSVEKGTAGRMPRAIVIAPTRELAMQSEQDAEEMFRHTGIESMAVFGGVDYDKQASQLKAGVDVIFATPGRLKDYIQKKWLKLDQIEIFVCDEADRMFDMGFIEDVEFFLERIPEAAQRLLFSATTNEQVKELAFEYLETPEYVSVNPETLTPEKIEQHAIHCHATDKLKVMLGLMREQNPVCSIIFTNTKLTAEWLHFKLVNNGIEADLITGDLPQKKRIKLIQNIKEGTLKTLIATDVASRGLHISRVTHVYNFDLPDEAANYIHRVGRTARAGARGFAYSLVCDDYGQNLAPINDLLGPTIALHTEWPNEAYMSIVDNAGDPFEGRWRKDRGPARAGAEFGRPAPRGDFRSGGRPSDSRGGPRRSDGRGGPRDNGPRDNGPRDNGPRDNGPRDNGPRDNGPRSSGPRDNGPRSGGPRDNGPRSGGPRDNGPRSGDNNRGRPRDDQQRPDAAQRPVSQAGAPNADGDAEKKRRRRRRGRGQGPDGGQPGLDQHADGRARQGGEARGGRPDGGRGPQGGRGQDDRHSAAGAGDVYDAQPKTMGSMLKKIVKTLFGWGK